MARRQRPQVVPRVLATEWFPAATGDRAFRRSVVAFASAGARLRSRQNVENNRGKVAFCWCMIWIEQGEDVLEASSVVIQKTYEGLGLIFCSIDCKTDVRHPCLLTVLSPKVKFDYIHIYIYVGVYNIHCHPTRDTGRG